MTTSKKAGIWMDHASAHIMEFGTSASESKTVESTFTHSVKEESLSKGDSTMHNKERQQQGAYYEKLGEAIKEYDEVLLFGPTDAKVELYNVLRANHHFDKIKIETQQADKMTENQQHAFVKTHFLKHIPHL